MSNLRAITKIGDIFEAKVSDTTKRYFQFVANDLSQLNSDVIRSFKKEYLMDEVVDVAKIIQDEVCFYAHCTINIGVKMDVWKKIGKHSEVGAVDNILFRSTNDYGIKKGEEPIKISHNWWIWKINEKRVNVGKLEGKNKKAFVGLIINPLGIIELLKGNKYPPTYPGFE